MQNRARYSQSPEFVAPRFWRLGEDLRISQKGNRITEPSSDDLKDPDSYLPTVDCSVLFAGSAVWLKNQERSRNQPAGAIENELPPFATLKRFRR